GTVTEPLERGGGRAGDAGRVEESAPGDPEDSAPGRRGSGFGGAPSADHGAVEARARRKLFSEPGLPRAWISLDHHDGETRLGSANPPRFLHALHTGGGR